MEKQSLVSHRKRKSRNEFQEAIPKHLWKKLPSWGVTLLDLFCTVLWNLYIFIIAASHDLYMLLAASIPLLSRRDLYYNGLQSHDKEMAWSDDVDMKDIKVVRDAFGGTLNDVMLAVVTRCIKSYLDDLNIRRDNYVQLIIPISLREPSDWR